MASGRTSPPVLSPATGASGPSAHPPSRSRIVLSAVGLIFLAGVVTVAAVLEMRASRAVMSEPQTRLAAPQPRPPFTRAEEAYIRALWPIHGDVERSPEDVRRRRRGTPARGVPAESGRERQDQRGRGEVLARRVSAELACGKATVV